VLFRFAAAKIVKYFYVLFEYEKIFELNKSG